MVKMISTWKQTISFLPFPVVQYIYDELPLYKQNIFYEVQISKKEKYKTIKDEFF